MERKERESLNGSLVWVHGKGNYISVLEHLYSRNSI